MPLLAITVVVPARVPPDAVTSTGVVESVVTVFPELSARRTIGCVDSAEPEAPATGWVLISSCVADPGPEG